MAVLAPAACALTLALALPGGPGRPAGPPPGPMVSPVYLASQSITAPRQPGKKAGKKSHHESAPDSAGAVGLGPERARILLRSLTVPGWGQATLGHRGSARVFLAIEAGIWGSFLAFRIQEAQRTDSYLRTAQLDAGIDLRGQDDELRKIVGSYASSEEYNLLVVSRDAANLYLSDPENQDIESYRAYIAEHSLAGDLTWQWSDESAFLRYGGQRKSAQRAGLRANTTLALAIANRLASALHAARLAGRSENRAQGWRFDLQPDPASPGALRAALTTNF